MKKQRVQAQNRRRDALTATQIEALSVLSEYIFKSACEMGLSQSTLQALQRQGLVENKRGLGAEIFPRNAIGWRKKK